MKDIHYSCTKCGFEESVRDNGLCGSCNYQANKIDTDK